jgi:hypothetical protein
MSETFAVVTSTCTEELEKVRRGMRRGAETRRVVRKDAGSIPAASTADFLSQHLTFDANPCHQQGFRRLKTNCPQSTHCHQLTHSDSWRHLKHCQNTEREDAEPPGAGHRFRCGCTASSSSRLSAWQALWPRSKRHRFWDTGSIHRAATDNKRFVGSIITASPQAIRGVWRRESMTRIRPFGCNFLWVPSEISGIPRRTDFAAKRRAMQPRVARACSKGV